LGETSGHASDVRNKNRIRGGTRYSKRNAASAISLPSATKRQRRSYLRHSAHGAGEMSNHLAIQFAGGIDVGISRDRADALNHYVEILRVCAGWFHSNIRAQALNYSVRALVSAAETGK
jgi:hypothetical protein